jgi:hypothetical protein
LKFFLIPTLLKLFSIAKINQKFLINAANSLFSDFEDAVLYQAGIYIVLMGLLHEILKILIWQNIQFIPLINCVKSSQYDSIKISRLTTPPLLYI